MSFVRRLTVPFTTEPDGSATVYSDAVNGLLQSIRYVYDDGDTGADFTITTETTGQPILTVTNAGTASLSWQPRSPVHAVADASVITGGYAPIAIADERIEIVVAQGGNAKSGTFEIMVA